MGAGSAFAAGRHLVVRPPERDAEDQLVFLDGPWPPAPTGLGPLRAARFTPDGGALLAVGDDKRGGSRVVLCPVEAGELREGLPLHAPLTDAEPWPVAVLPSAEAVVVRVFEPEGRWWLALAPLGASSPPASASASRDDGIAPALSGADGRGA